MEYKFQKLTPTSDVDLSVYENALQYVFSEQDIRNVAIAGAYSSGKSSVIAAFEERHKSEIFLHISLAHFAQENTEEDVDYIMEKLPGIVSRLREMSPLYEDFVRKHPQAK